jgi:hypothetical protein
MKTVVASDEHMHQAEGAVRALVDAGLPLEAISLTATSPDTEVSDRAALGDDVDLPERAELRHTDVHALGHQPMSGTTNQLGERAAIGATVKEGEERREGVEPDEERLPSPTGR